MSQDRVVTTPLSTSTFKSELNVAVRLKLPTGAVSEESKKTGDKYIDEVLTALQALAGEEDDAKRRVALAPLFDRAAFREPRQEDWDHFLYAVCRTRLLVHSEIKKFNSPKIKRVFN